MDQRLRDFYIESQVNNASPGQVLIMLYDFLLEHAECAEQEIKSPADPADHRQAAREVTRCIKALTELNGCLRHGVDPALCATLSDLYRFFTNQLSESLEMQDSAKIREIIPLIQKLRNTWVEADRRANKYQPGSVACRRLTIEGKNFVHKNPRVIFLESREGVESLFTRGLRSGATACGWHPQVIFLADSAGVPRSEKDVRIDLLKAHADAICFLMDAPLDLKNIWDAPSLAQVDKISFWFDDYFRSPRTLGRPDVWADWQARHNVRVGIWDGYWRCQWKKFTGADAFPLHLGADPRQLRPAGEPWHKEWSDRAVFTGTIPSRKSLDEFAAAFPSHLRRFLEEICTAMNTAAWPLRPYELGQKCRSFLPIRYTRAIDATLKDPTTLALWNQLLWRWGKRIARLRGLAAVAKAGPIAVQSGHHTEAFAGEEEIRAALPKGTDFVFTDTTDVPAQQWNRLFRTGKFQVQITDPQSIEGGLPFRVFECGACAVPLLSDHRPELAALCRPGNGLFTAIDEASLQLVAAQMFHMSKRDLDKQGLELHRDFLADHTWEARWRSLMEGRELRSQKSPFAHLEGKSTPPPKPVQTPTHVA